MIEPKKQIGQRQSQRIATILLAVGAILFLIAYLGMTLGIFAGILNHPLLDWLASHRRQTATNILDLFTNILSPAFVYLITSIIVALWIALKRELLRPLLLAGAMLSSALVSTVIKFLTASSRPTYELMVLPIETDYSFPSGHTISLAVLLLVLGYLIFSRNFNKTRFLTWLFSSGLLIIFMAVSRLYLGYHWLTDVIASIGLGAIILSLTILIDDYFNQKDTKANALGTDQ